MLEHARERMRLLQSRMREDRIDLAVFTDESSIAYLGGFWGYLSVEFGRPTFLVVRSDEEPIVITPLMERELVSRMTWVNDVRTWEDAGPRGWPVVLGEALGSTSDGIWIETHLIPAIVRNYLDEAFKGVPLHSISPLLGEQRMIKSPFEIGIMKQAGLVAGAMMGAAHDATKAGVPEYEAALAIMAAGTRKAAGFLTDQGWDAFVSPLIHNLQIMQSGSDTSMVHHRASVKKIAKGDPVYFCFCNMAQFKQYKLGFDRVFFVEHASDQAIKVQRAAIDAQQAALRAVRAGVTAESVAFAANASYAAAGYTTSYRTGRSIGVSYLEAPELKAGDKTILRAGMTFAVDGGIGIEGEVGGRIGDSIVVTETGFDYITDYPRDILYA